MSQRRTVFLSASIPAQDREPFFSEFEKRSTYYRLNLREAILALVGVCYELDLDLVFGGHPAITPFVHRAARALGHDFGGRESLDGYSQIKTKATQHSEPSAMRSDRREWRIVVYQSMYFQNLFPSEVQDFQNRHTGFFEPVEPLDDYPVPKSKNEIDDKAKELNIAVMRDRMINNFPGQYVFGVFMGGMEGIIDEFHRFRTHWPQAPCLPLPSTGGATEIGWQPPYNEKFLAAIPESHPRPPQRPLLEQVLSRSTHDHRSYPANLKEIKILTEEMPPVGVTYRTCFRRLFRARQWQ